MVETKPGLTLDENEICQACRHMTQKSEINYNSRREKLHDLADKHRREHGYYDCIIPVSGGKDSHFQTHIMMNELDMNPLLVGVLHGYERTEAGKHNLENLREAFDCDLLTMQRDWKPNAG